ncbi:putative peptidylprolyl isomerase [Helianthus annuus]|nr:putative peptidylprolyl isomerase [Helianthus annuus]KAJ0766792.1 putative peptidylprolyl isomerase [Helianthus annuus]KAJ0772676.1 putative peptidylprolyl isomerase [Helianthus annuus]
MISQYLSTLMLVFFYFCCFFLVGMDVVANISSIPTYKPGERVRQYNDFAEFIGDERAKSARAIWDRPQKTLYISNCGEVKVTKPTLSPSLP